MLTVYDKKRHAYANDDWRDVFPAQAKVHVGTVTDHVLYVICKFLSSFKGQKKQTNYKIDMKIFSWLSHVIRFFLFTA